MAASMQKLMFLIFLSLQLSAILSDDEGMSMTLHMSSSHHQGYERASKMVQASKDRAWALKHGIHRQMKTRKEIDGKESLYARSDINEYSIKFSVGTPPQDLLLVMDTGSSVVWVPCTRNYTCNNCTVFLPRKSSSSVPVKCADAKCKDLCGNGNGTGRCFGSIHKCSRACPDYVLVYGTGATAGQLLSETLTLPLEEGGTREIKNFGVGCSLISLPETPPGIAGFGRGALSMPSQLSPLIGDKFAYCLQSKLLFDDQNKSSKMVLGDKAVPKDIPLNHTRFLNNSRAPFYPYSDFYYIGLKRVSVGGKRLKLPSKLLRFDTKGNGGTIIDSGTSFTLFPETIYNQIAGEFASQIGYRRAREVEAITGLGLCYNFSGVEYTNIQLPEFSFHFKGGSDMVLPDENCFVQVSSDSFCLAMLNSSVLDNATGPSVILGNYQQQNFYILYDREKNRLGFTQQSCQTFG
jgi:hypothetical protein